MDPQKSAKDVVVFCKVRDTPVPQLHCDFCQTNLSKACAGCHILDLSKNISLYRYKTNVLLNIITFVQNMSKSYVNITVNNVTYLFVLIVFL